MTTFGIDCTSLPPMDAMRAAGVRFACRYLSHSTWKNLTRDEVATCRRAGIDIVTVWETTARRMLDGHAAGVSDARDAEAMLRLLGAPAAAPVYFAADWDAKPSEQGAIEAYLDGAASVIGRGRVGMYGGYWPVSRAFDERKIAYGWQTYAWSGGHWDDRAHIRQYSNSHKIGGTGVDYNHAMKSDFGQWGGLRVDPVADVTPAPVPDNWMETIMQRMPTLERGSEDTAGHVQWVRRLQGLLCALGPNIAIDGDYGPATEARVREEQRQYGLVVDGICGPHTWAHLLTGSDI